LGKAVSVINVDKDEVIKVLRFDSETGTPGYDSIAKKIYVTLRSTNEVVEVDPSTDRVIRRYPVEGCGIPTAVTNLAESGRSAAHGRASSRQNSTSCMLP
jgi:DNA-binding beta-propeller fold protein YncE